MSSPQVCSVVQWNKSQRAVHLWLSHPLTRGELLLPRKLSYLPPPACASCSREIGEEGCLRIVLMPLFTEPLCLSVMLL